MNTTDFIYKALNGTTTRDSCASVVKGHDWSDDPSRVVVYSYGSHYPLATIHEGHAFINNTGYSATTSQHICKAWSACSLIVGYSNVHYVHLNSRDFTLADIVSSARVQRDEIIAVMDSKKRKNTHVYAMLERDLANIQETLSVAEMLLRQGEPSIQDGELITL